MKSFITPLPLISVSKVNKIVILIDTMFGQSHTKTKWYFFFFFIPQAKIME